MALLYPLQNESNIRSTLDKHWENVAYIFAKLQKRTYIYNSLQFPGEMSASGSKTPTFCPFTQMIA